MVYAKFVHGESRPVDGIPDPHYHIHVFAMNATFDEVEKEWKALEVGNTVGDRTFYEAHFHHLLAAKLDASAYGIRRTEHHFEFASVSRELVEKFSRLTELIEQRARDKYKVLEAEARALMKSTNMAFDDAFAHVIAEIGGDWDKWKSNLGARNRESKEPRGGQGGELASCAEGAVQPHHARVRAQAGCSGRKVEPATGDGDPSASRLECPVGIPGCADVADTEAYAKWWVNDCQPKLNRSSRLAEG
jgi:hypothetical protein